MRLLVPQLNSGIQLFHGSPISGLKYLRAEVNKTSHTDDKRKRVYATPLKNVASAFCFTWDNNHDIKLGISNNKAPLTMTIPAKYNYLLNKSCSIYTVDGAYFFKIEKSFLKEHYAYRDIKVVSEQKFKTVYEAFDQTGLNYKII